MSGLSERLGRAMGNEEMSVRKLSAILSDVGVKGASRPSISDYIQGKTDPSLEFLRGASEVLRVSFEWLATGLDPHPQHDVRRAVIARFEVLGTLSIGVQETFMDVVFACWRQAPDHTESNAAKADIVRDEMLLIAQDLIELLTLPLGSWGLRELDELNPDERSSYFYSALGAYSIVVRRRSAGHLMADRSSVFADERRRVVDEERSRLRDCVAPSPSSGFAEPPPAVVADD